MFRQMCSPHLGIYSHWVMTDLSERAIKRQKPYWEYRTRPWPGAVPRNKSCDRRKTYIGGWKYKSNIQLSMLQCRIIIKKISNRWANARLWRGCHSRYVCDAKQPANILCACISAQRDAHNTAQRPSGACRNDRRGNSIPRAYQWLNVHYWLSLLLI